MLFTTNDCIQNPTEFVRLWTHETRRVYKDKLCEAKDIETFDKAQKDIVKKCFDEVTDSDIFISPLIYCHFARGIGEPKYMAISTWDSLQKLLFDALKGYNELNAAMDLVLFEDAMMHICKINRILESPRSNVSFSYGCSQSLMLNYR